MSRLSLSTWALAGSLLLAPVRFVPADEAPRTQGRRQIETFDYRGARLDDGHPLLMLDEVKEYYLRIPTDDLLKGFRQRAGHPAPGHDLGGWYTSDTFHVFGQIVSGLARLYAASGDPACRDKVNALVAEWTKCIAADGYFYALPKPNAPHYIYDKIVGGLVDAYLYCDNREAMKSLSRITEWAEQHLERSRRVGDTSTEWYTLSENLYRAYLATGDPRYRDFAAVWEYSEYWNTYARRADPFAKRPERGLPRLQPRQHARRCRCGIPRHGRPALSQHSAKRLRLPAGTAVLCHRRLRPRRTAPAARPICRATRNDRQHI
jgi:hypothetical protein